MNDRQPTKPNRVKITFDDGTVQFGYIERADEPTVEGTALNKANLFDNRNSERYACEVPNDAFLLLTQDLLVDVPANGWSNEVNADGFYYQTVAVDGMSAQHAPLFAPEITTADGVDSINGTFALIVRMTTADGYVTFLATDLPPDNIKIRLRGV